MNYLKFRLIIATLILLSCVATATISYAETEELYYHSSYTFSCFSIFVPTVFKPEKHSVQRSNDVRLIWERDEQEYFDYTLLSLYFEMNHRAKSKQETIQNHLDFYLDNSDDSCRGNEAQVLSTEPYTLVMIENKEERRVILEFDYLHEHLTISVTDGLDRNFNNYKEIANGIIQNLTFRSKHAIHPSIEDSSPWLFYFNKVK